MVNRLKTLAFTWFLKRLLTNRDFWEKPRLTRLAVPPITPPTPLGLSGQLAVVAQLVRVPACHAGGRGFEPRQPRHFLKLNKRSDTKCSSKDMAFLYSEKGYFTCAVLIILDDLARAALFLGHVSKLTLLCYPTLSFNR